MHKQGECFAEEKSFYAAFAGLESFGEALWLEGYRRGKWSPRAVEQSFHWKDCSTPQ